jgi:hypothetical protein
MTIGASANQITQLGVESPPGTQATITKKLRSASIDFDPQKKIKEFTPMGLKFSSAHVLNQSWSQAKLTGILAYSEAHYWLSSLMRQTTPSAVVVGSTWQASHVYTSGDYVRPTVSNAHLYQAQNSGTSGSSQPTFPTSAGATVVDSGVTWKEVGSDVSGAYSWSFDISSEQNDTLQTYTFEQGDQALSRVRKAIYCSLKDFSVTSKRSGDASISGTFLGRSLSSPGSLTTSGVSEVTLVPVSTQEVDVYMDSSSAALGTTKMASNFDIGLQFKDRVDIAWIHDRSVGSFLQYLTRVPKFEIDLTLADDSDFDQIQSYETNKQRVFVRFEAQGGQISPGVNYLIQWDVACQVSAAEQFGNEGSARICKVKLAAEHDGTWGKATAAKVVNTAAAL